MCQGYEAERRFVELYEDEENLKGRPNGCSFQAGYFQCPNQYNRNALHYTRERIGKRKYGDIVFGDRFGWECRTCGTFYPELDPEEVKKRRQARDLEAR